MASRLAPIPGRPAAGERSTRGAADRQPDVVPRPELPSAGNDDAPCRTDLDDKRVAHDAGRQPAPKKLRPGLY